MSKPDLSPEKWLKVQIVSRMVEKRNIFENIILRDGEKFQLMPNPKTLRLHVKK